MLHFPAIKNKNGLVLIVGNEALSIIYANMLGSVFSCWKYLVTFGMRKLASHYNNPLYST